MIKFLHSRYLSEEGSGSQTSGSVSQERAVGNASVDQRSGGVEDGSVGEHGPVSHDMSGSVGSGSGSVCRHAIVGYLHDTDICLTSLITKICAK